MCHLQIDGFKLAPFCSHKMFLSSGLVCGVVTKDYVITPSDQRLNNERKAKILEIYVHDFWLELTTTEVLSINAV